jgi:hypothetical protein
MFEEPGVEVREQQTQHRRAQYDPADHLTQHRRLLDPAHELAEGHCEAQHDGEL